MKKIILFFCIFISSCAVKNNIGITDCIVSNMYLADNNKNIQIKFTDNGCKYSYKQLDKKVWKISINNGKFASFSPNAENNIKKDVPVIKKNKREIILYFAENGVITQKNNNTFIYNQKNAKLNIPFQKASYIEGVQCFNKEVKINGNGAFRTYSGILYNGQKYVDIFDVSLKKDYIHSKKCKNISSPVLLSYPKRIRYFINNIKGNIFVNNIDTGILLSLEKNENNHLITNILEEMSDRQQKIILETSSNISVISVKTTPIYTIIILKDRYSLINKAINKTKLKGNIFKDIEVNKKSTVTEIKFYNKYDNIKNYISIDNVDNKLIIYATKL